MTEIREILRKIANVYIRMDTPIRSYLLYYLLPTVFASALVSSVLFTTISSLIPTPILLLASIIPSITVLIYPFMIENRKTIQIESNFPLFVTQATVLSYTNTNRIDVFRRIASDSNYGALSEEIGELVGMVETFNMSLDDAARRRSKLVSSNLLSDFYEKLAYNLSSGNSLNNFLISEQESVKEMYAARYEARLSNMETIGELFLSANMASTFLLVFSVVSPLLTGMNPQILIVSVFGLYVMVQIAFIILMNTQSPKDKLWYVDDSNKSDRMRKIQISTTTGILLSIVVFYILFILNLGISLYPKVIISVFPLLSPAYVHIKEEKHIQRTEDQFSSFIRGLGNVESVKKTSTSDVLSRLKEKDFGDLKPYIKRLYRRLFIGTDNRVPWSLFSAEINSFMVKEFTDMYVTGRDLGGNPKKVGDLVSKNYRHLSKLRKKKKTETNNITGYVYGMTVAWSVTVFMTLQITEILVSVASATGGELSASILSTTSYNTVLIQNIIYGTVMANIIIVSFMIRISQRKILTGVVTHIMVLSVLCFGVGWGIEYAVEQFLDIGV